MCNDYFDLSVHAQTITLVLFWVIKTSRIEAVLQNLWKKSSNYRQWLFDLIFFIWKQETTIISIWPKDKNNILLSFQSFIVYKIGVIYKFLRITRFSKTFQNSWLLDELLSTHLEQLAINPFISLFGHSKFFNVAIVIFSRFTTSQNASTFCDNAQTYNWELLYLLDVKNQNIWKTETKFYSLISSEKFSFNFAHSSLTRFMEAFLIVGIIPYTIVTMQHWFHCFVSRRPRRKLTYKNLTQTSITATPKLIELRTFESYGLTRIF